MPSAMRSSMTRLTSLFAASVLGVSSASAQLNPVRLNVNKVEKKDRQTTYRSADGQYRREQLNSATSSTVQLVNVSGGSLSNIRVKWAVLVDSSHAEARATGISTTNGKLDIVEGERTCSLDLGQRYSFDTDVIELSAAMAGSDYSGSRWNYGGKVLGYAVEVFVDRKPGASEIQPSDTKKRIEQVKADEQKPKTETPGRHRF